jgi:hypothetical protein
VHRARYGKFAFVLFFGFNRSFRLFGLGLLSLSLLVNPVVETRTVSIITGQLPVVRTFRDTVIHLPCNLESVKLHAGNKDGGVLLVLDLGAVANHGTKIVVVDLLLVLHHEVAPPVLSVLALHLVLVNLGGGVELGEGLLKVLHDLVVDLGEAKRRALDALEDGPVGLHVLDDLDGELLLDLWAVG